MKRILKIAKWLLLVWGGLSLIGTLTILSLIAYGIGVGNQDQTDKASPHDVRFVLN